MGKPLHIHVQVHLHACAVTSMAASTERTPLVSADGEGSALPAAAAWQGAAGGGGGVEALTLMCGTGQSRTDVTPIATGVCAAGVG